MPTVTIDGQQIGVPEGTTIIQAAEMLDIHIPRYCYHPGLSIAGSCRMCLVQVEKTPKLQIACYTPVSEGMAVHTNTEQVVKARQAILEFLLLNHPVDCPVCDQAGECWLQEYYMEYGLYDSALLEDKVRKRKAVILGPHIVLDTERCILCSRCLRFCDEITKTHELGIFERGDRSEIWLYPGKVLDNKYCGNVADICPVGSLTDRDFRFICRVWYLENVNSICPCCSTGCNIIVDYNLKRPHAAKGRRLMRLRPRYNPEVNKWWMCDEGRYGFKFVDASDRILDPARKENDKLKPIPWEEALGRVARAIRALVDEGRQEQIGIITSRWSTNEELYMARRLFVEQLGVKGLDHRVPGNIVGQDDGFLIRADKSPNSKGAELIAVHHPEGMDATQIVQAASQGKIKLLYVLHHDLAEAFGNKLIQKVSQNTELLVYQGTNFNQTSDQADVVLPAAAWPEKEGTFTNYAGRVQKINEAFAPPGRAWPDGKIFVELASRLGAPFRYICAEDIFREMADRVEPFKGMSYSSLGLTGSLVSSQGE